MHIVIIPTNCSTLTAFDHKTAVMCIDLAHR